MSHATHSDHTHVHDEHCGHPRVSHGGHIDYLHDGHLHAEHEGHYDEHTVAVDATHPTACAPVPCAGDHQGEAVVPHGDHTDYLVGGRLHHVHGDHCDDHGPLSVQ